MISIIIPVFNSENTIEILVNNIVQALGENYKFEIILVNDCSKDKTEEKESNPKISFYVSPELWEKLKEEGKDYMNLFHQHYQILLI